MVVGAISSRTQLAVIGAGPGGYVSALRAAQAGIEVTLIDSDRLGGTCLNVGCIPSKALIEIADTYHRARTNPALVGALQVNLTELRTQVSGVPDPLRSGLSGLIDRAGITVMPGTARFARRDRLGIEHDGAITHLEFDHAIVATGSRPIALPNFEWSERVVDSAGLLALDRLPESLAVIGAGYIGVELGTALAKLGSRVTLIEAQSAVLPGVPAELARPVQARLRGLDVTVLAETLAVEPRPGSLVVADRHSGEQAEVEAEMILVAIGRRPNTDAIGLSAAGVTLDAQGLVQVDQQGRATPEIFAIGDATAGPALAHRASADGERAVDAILGRPDMGPALVPTVVFSDPEIMSVGVDLDDAEAVGATVHRFPFAALGRAHTMGRTDGACFVVVDGVGTIVGFHASGPHVSELAGEATLAIEMAATLDDITAVVHPHPTISESISESAYVAASLPLHI